MSQTSTQTQPWFAATIDEHPTCAPAVVATLIALGIDTAGHARAGVSLVAWAVLVIGIDVAHVYSTLYRTYLDPFERRQLSGWLIGTPLATWVLGVLLYTWSAATFWSVLAYTAVFHFVRQQYGFLMLYSRGERSVPRWSRRLDQAAIYSAARRCCVGISPPRPFVWFTDGDFLALPAILWRFALPLYIALFAAYLVKEVTLCYKTYSINWPRNALVLGTALSGMSIRGAAGDLGATLTNVVSHGIPTWP